MDKKHEELIPPRAIPREVVRAEEAAQSLSISRAKLYQLLADGTIPSISIGRCRRIPVRALEQWVEDQIAVAQKDQHEGGIER